MPYEDLGTSIAYLVVRYLHIVCTTLLVGGTLFYEMIVPIAIADMKEEQQLAVFARARWVFRRVVWMSVLLLVVTGIFSTQRHWDAYVANGEDYVTLALGPEGRTPVALRAGWWWVAHASTGFLACLIALGLTMGRRPPAYPVQWMRLNLVVLMCVIFLASATRQVRSAYTDRQMSAFPRVLLPLPSQPPTSGPAAPDEPDPAAATADQNGR